MIIKNKDDCQEQIDYLSDLLERNLPVAKKGMVERELKNLYSGKKGEESSAYYLDFEFRSSKNWMLIHDLRLEHNGDVAQIDHLLIGRMLDIYVVESKNFSQGVVISEEGDFCYFYHNKPIPIQSPLAQNERHIRLLDRFLTDNNLLPKRLGVTLRPAYKNIVLISPTSRLTKPKKGLYDCSAVMKSDKFLERFNNDLKDESIGSMMSIAKLISENSLRTFVEALVLAHTPTTINYLAKFGLEKKPPVNADVCKTASIADVKSAEEYEEKDVVRQELAAPACPKCGVTMVRRTTSKGKNAGREFWGCSGFPKCWGRLQDKDFNGTPAKMLIEDEAAPACSKCGESMVKRLAGKGKNAGKEFWGCVSYPKCRG
jgi:ssDNA-binding Zn-finger/Zn-ribbon topoisomerase 1